MLQALRGNCPPEYLERGQESISQSGRERTQSSPLFTSATFNSRPCSTSLFPPSQIDLASKRLAGAATASRISRKSAGRPTFSRYLRMTPGRSSPSYSPRIGHCSFSASSVSSSFSTKSGAKGRNSASSSSSRCSSKRTISVGVELCPFVLGKDVAIDGCSAPDRKLVTFHAPLRSCRAPGLRCGQAGGPIAKGTAGRARRATRATDGLPGHIKCSDQAER
jgi:hypothetical protein